MLAIELPIVNCLYSTERVNRRFRSESLNLFNRANFDSFGASIFQRNGQRNGAFAPTRELITSTTTTSRRVHDLDH